MAKTFFVLLGTAPLLSGVGCGGPSVAECQALCDWWAHRCTAEPISSCMDDCAEASGGDVAYASEQCLGRTVSTCKSASCCLRFVYTEYYYSTNCL